MNQYREGKVKSTPRGELNSSWNHMPTKSRSPLYVGDGVLFAERANELLLAAWLIRRGGRAIAKASLKRRLWSLAIDPKPSDLAMARVKLP